MAQRRKSATRHRFEPYPMTDVEGGPGFVDFTQTGRTGRRNALADILEPNHGSTSTSSLPGDMAKLKCTDDTEDDEESKSDAACALPKEKDEDSSKDKSKDAKKTSSSDDADSSETSKEDGS